MTKKAQKNNKMNSKQRKLFEDAYHAHKKCIYWYVYKKVSKQELAEDITAETFIKLVEHPEIIEERDSNGVKAWLYTVARNKVIDFYRKQGRAAQRVELEEEVFEIVAKEDGHYLEDAIKDEDAAVLLSAINILTASEKEVISLRFNDDLQFSEIAEMLEKKEGAVKMTLYRALEKLKQEIEGNQDLNIEA